MKQYLLLVVIAFVSLFYNSKNYFSDKVTPPVTVKLPIRPPVQRPNTKLLSQKAKIALKDTISSSQGGDKRFLTEGPGSFSVTTPLLPVKPLPFKKVLASDPIRFAMQATKPTVAIGEEFEITVVAELMPILPSQMFFFEAQRSYKLKVLLPKGFIQTGGTYYDYIGGSLSTDGLKKEEYTLKGYFTVPTDEPFALLRGGKDAGVSDIFEKKQELFIKTSPTSPVSLAGSRVGTSCVLQQQVIGLHYETKSTISKNKKVDSTSITVFVPDLARYEYSSDSVIFQKSNTIVTNDTTGFIIIRDSADRSCTLKIPYHYKKPFDDATTNEDGCSTVESYSPKTSLCDGDKTNIFSEGCRGETMYWIVNGVRKYDGYQNLINVGELGTYTAYCVCQGTAYPTRSITIVRENNCTPVIPRPTLIAQKPTICGGERSPLRVEGCTGRIKFYTVSENYYGFEATGPTSGSVYIYDRDNGVQPGTYTAACIVNNTEGPRSDNVTVTEYCPPPCSAPNSPNIGGDLSRCSGNTSTLVADGCETNNYRWYTSSSGGSSINSSSSYTTPTLYSTATYYVSCANSCGESGRTAVTVTVKDCPIPCSGTSIPKPTIEGDLTLKPGKDYYILEAKGCASNQTVRWYRSDGGRFFPDGQSFGFHDPANGFSVYARCVSGDCEGPQSATKTFTDGSDPCSSMPTPTIWGETNLTPGTASATLQAQGCAAGQTARWYRSDGNSFSPDGLSFTFNGDLNGLSVYARCVSSNCVGPQSATKTFTVSSNPCPTAPRLHQDGSDVTSFNVCPGTTLGLLAEGCPSGVKWYRQSDNALVYNGNPYAPVIGESVVFYARCIGANGCPDSDNSNTLNITVQDCPGPCNGMPTPTIWGETNLTPGTASATLQAQGCAAGQTARWYRSDGNSFSPDGLSFTFNGDLNGLSVYARCVSSNCVGPQSATKTFTVSSNPCPTAPRLHQDGSDVTSFNVCPGTTLGLLAEGCPSGVKWYRQSDNALVYNGNPYAPVIGESVVFYARCIGANGCPDSDNSNTLNITVQDCPGPCNGMPTPTIWGETNLTPGTASATLQAQGCAAGQTARWYRSDGNSFSPDGLSFTFNGDLNGLSVYARCVSSNCVGPQSATKTFTVSSNPCPTAPRLHQDGSDVTSFNVCPGTTLGLLAEGCPSGVKWYRQSDNALVYNGNPYAPVIGESVVFYARCIGANGCPDSDNSNTLNITVQDCPGPCNGMPTPTIWGETNLTPGTASATLQAQGCAAGQTARWYRSDGNSFSPDGLSFTFNGDLNGLSVYARCVSSNCVGPQSATKTFTVSSNPCPTAPRLHQDGSDVTSFNVCPGTTLGLLAEGCPSGVKWYRQSDNALVYNGNPYRPVIGESVVFYARCIGANGCPDSDNSNTLNITVKAKPDITPKVRVVLERDTPFNNLSEYTVCEHTEVIFGMDRDPANSPGYSMRWTGPNGSPIHTINKLTDNWFFKAIKTSQQGLYTYTVTNPDGCSNSAQVDVKVTPANYLGTIDETKCNLITGWLVDFNCQDRSNKIRIFIDGELVDTTEANHPRGDVRENVLGRTTGYERYGIYWTVPERFRQGVHTVVITDMNGNKLNNWENKTFGIAPPKTFVAANNIPFSILSGPVTVCAGSFVALGRDRFPPDNKVRWSGPDGKLGPDNQDWYLYHISPSQAGPYTFMVTDINGCTNSAQVTINVTPPDYLGNLEEANCNRAKGWIINRNCGESPVQLFYYFDGQLVDSSYTNVPRDDAKMHVFGNKDNFINYGFEWPIPASFRQGVHTLRITDNMGTTLFGPTEYGVAMPTMRINGQNFANGAQYFVCEGSQLTLDLDRNPANYSIRWSGPNGSQGPVNDKWTINAIGSLQQGLYTYTVTNPDGCSRSAQVNIQLSTKPVFGFSAAGSDQVFKAVNTNSGPASLTVTICDGGNMAMSNLNWPSPAYRLVEHLQTNGNVEGYAADRAPNDVDAYFASLIFSKSYGPFKLINPAVVGTFTQSYMPYVDSNNNGHYDVGVDCAGDPIILTYVFTPPVKPTAPTFNGSSTPSTTQGTSVLFSSSCPSGGQVKWVRYNAQGSIVGYAIQNEVTFDSSEPVGSSHYTVECINTPCPAAPTDFTFTVLPTNLFAPLEPTFNGGNNPSTCEGAPVVFTSGCSSGTVHWTRYNSSGGSQIGEAYMNPLGFAANMPAGQYYYSVECADNGRFGPSKTFTFTVHGKPVVSPPVRVAPNAFTTNSSYSICEGTYVAFGRDRWPANFPDYIMQWTGPNNSRGEANQDWEIQAIQAAQEGIYTYTVTDPNGCSNSTQVNIKVNPANLLGTIDETSCNRITGWLVDFNCQERSNKVRILIDDELVETLEANVPRGDVRLHILGRSDGYEQYGFNWAIPARFRQGMHSVLVTDIKGNKLNNWENRSFGIAPPSAMVSAGAPFAAASSYTVCEQTKVVLGIDRDPASNPGYAMQWTGPNNSRGEANQDWEIQAIQAAQEGIYTYTVTDPNGCSNSTQVNIEVNAKPVFGFAASGSSPASYSANTTGSVTNNVTICSGGMLTFSGFTQSQPNIGLLEKSFSSGNVTLGGDIQPTERAQNNISSGQVASGFNQSYGPYAVTNGSMGTIEQWYTPYIDQNGNGQYDSGECLGDKITLLYKIVPLTKPTSVSASPGSISSARSVTLSASGCANTTKWEWPSGTATGSTLVTTVNQTTTFGVRCVNGTGCQSDTIAITVRQLNMPAPIISASKLSVCGGDTVTLRATGCNNDATVLWSNGMTGSSIVFAPTATANYYAVCKVDEAQGGRSQEIRINVRAMPTVTGTRSYLSGQTLSLTAFADGASSYSWKGPRGFTYTGAKLEIQGVSPLSTAGSYTVTANYTGGGCSPSTVVVVSVNGPALQTGEISQTSACAGSVLSVPFSTTSASSDFASGNIFTIQLSDMGGNFNNPVTIGNGSASPITVTIPANTLPGTAYRVRVMSSDPLSEGTVSPTILTVTAPPSLSASSNSPGGQVRIDSTLRLTTSGQNLTGATYRWTGPNGFTSTVANPTIPHSTTAHNGIYTVTATTPSGCTATAQTSVSLTMAACTLRFASEPVVGCDSAAADTTRQGKIVVQLQNVPAGSALRITLYQQTTVVATLTTSPALFTGLTDGAYRIDAYALIGADTCRAGSRTLTVRCNSGLPDIRIKSVDATQKETDKLPRINGGFGTLQLSVETLDGEDLTGYTYLWTEPTSTSATTSTATSATLTARRIGEYKVTMVRGTDTLVAYITISALPCTERNATYTSCKTVTVNSPNATNTLSNLAPGDIFYAGDYKVEVTQASSSGNGWTGEGTVEVTLINGFALPAQVTFDNIKLNDCYELISGSVITKYDPSWFLTTETKEVTQEVNDIGSKVNDLISAYTGVAEDKIKVDEVLKEIDEAITSIQNNTELEQEVKDQMISGLYDTQCVLQQISTGLDSTGRNQGARLAASSCDPCFPPTSACWDKVKKGVVNFLSGVWDWAKREVTCYSTYQEQKELVPRCWWVGYNDQSSSLVALPVPMVAGFVDQLWEDTRSGFQAVGKHLTCFTPNFTHSGGPYVENKAYYSKDCQEYRTAFNGIMPTAKQLLFKQISSLIDGSTLNEFVGYVSDDSNCGADATAIACRYYKAGVILFNALAIYDGVKGGVAILKTGRAVLQAAMKRTSRIVAGIRRAGTAKVISSLKGMTYYYNGIKIGTDVGEGLVLASRTDNIGAVVGSLDDVDVYNPATKRTETVKVEFDNQGHCKVTGKCFVAGTLIATDKGLKAIERITTADRVLSRDELTGQQSYKRVVQTFVKTATRLVKVFAGNDTLLTTPEHPFRIVNQWVGAKALHKGDILDQAAVVTVTNVPYLPRSGLEVDSIAVFDTTVTVYNFEVADFHTYFVGKQVIWVHNACNVIHADPNTIYNLSGQKPLNSSYAKKWATAKGGQVYFDGNGFPDFTPYVPRDASGNPFAYQINMQGIDDLDFAAANIQAGFGTSKDAHKTFMNGQYKDYVWHHHQDTKTMMLVPNNINTARYGGISHSGGRAVLKHNNTPGNDFLIFSSPIFR